MPVDIVCFGAAASACEKGKQWQLALCLLSEMSDRILQPNLFTFNAVISACGHAREWARALSLLQLLGSEADVVSYNAVTRLNPFESKGIFVIVR
jgi:pentatricopeptide repeat domain-containing protein 1